MNQVAAMLRRFAAAFDAGCASAGARTALALVVVLVLAAGGDRAARASGGDAVAGDVVEGTRTLRRAASAAPRGRPLLARAAPCRRDHRPAPLRPRWTDLRHGGLPAPRAPDGRA